MRFTAWLALLAPVAFWTTVFVVGATRASYSWTGDFVSDLSSGPQGWIERLSLSLLGLAELPFIAALRHPSGGRPPRSLSISLVMAAAGTVAMGLFPAFQGQTPVVAALHVAAFVTAGAGLAVACLLAPSHPAVDAVRRPLAIYCRLSFVLGTVGFAALCAHVIWSHFYGPTPLTPYQGLLERAAGILLTSWLVAFAWGFALSPARRSLMPAT